MADNTIIQQGTFVSAGTNETIALRSNVDWMETWNLTTSAAAAQWASTYHYWQRGMAFGDHIIDYHAAATQVISRTTGVAGFNAITNRPGFYPIDVSAIVPGAAIAVTAGTNATAPVYNTANTGPIAVGSIVRIQNTAHTNLNGLDFTVGAVTPGVSFTLGNPIATAPGVVAGALGTYRFICADVSMYKQFYPQNRVIANITAAHPAVITTLVDHSFTTGQLVRIKVPAACGMTQMDGLTGTVTNVGFGTFSVNIDATAFTAFNFPLPGVVPFTPAEVVPVGSTPSLILPNTGDATEDTSYIGIVLGSLGAVSGTPTGVAGDVIKWRAGKSFNGI